MSRIKDYLIYLRIAMLAVLLVVIILTQFGYADSSADIGTVASAVTAGLDMDSVEEGSNRMFKKFYGLNASDYDSVVLYTPISNMDAEEILIIKLADDSQAEEVEEAINTRLTTQMNSFEGYGIEQYALLEDAVLDVRGNYILYIVHADAEKADEAFRGSL